MSTCEVMALPAAGGVYYKGTVLDARVPPTAGLASPDELAAFDPWESVRVEWDVTARDEERIQVSRRSPQILKAHAVLLSKKMLHMRSFTRHRLPSCVAAL